MGTQKDHFETLDRSARLLPGVELHRLVEDLEPFGLSATNSLTPSDEQSRFGHDQSPPLISPLSDTLRLGPAPVNAPRPAGIRRPLVPEVREHRMSTPSAPRGAPNGTSLRYRHEAQWPANSEAASVGRQPGLRDGAGSHGSIRGQRAVVLDEHAAV
jgi:hypothetical protein